MPNWLPNFPNFKETIENSFRDYVKTPLEQKANELNTKLEQKANELESKGEAIAQEFQTNAKNFQQAIITLLFASFCIGVIVLTWKETNHDK